MEKAAEFRSSDLKIGAVGDFCSIFLRKSSVEWVACGGVSRRGEVRVANVQTGHKLRGEEGYLHNSFFLFAISVLRLKREKKCLIIKSALGV